MEDISACTNTQSRLGSIKEKSTRRETGFIAFDEQFLLADGLRQQIENIFASFVERHPGIFFFDPEVSVSKDVSNLIKVERAFLVSYLTNGPS